MTDTTSRDLSAADAALGTGDYDTAERGYDALRDSPQHRKQALIGLARVAAARQSFGDAARLFAEAVEAAPHNADLTALLLSAIGTRAETPSTLVLTAAQILAKAGVATLPVQRLESLVPALARLIREGQKPPALALLRRVAEREDAPEEALCLIVEHAADAAYRKSIAQRLLAAPQITPRARRVLSNHVRETWAIEDQGSPLDLLYQADPKDFVPYLNLIRYYARVGMLERMRALLDSSADFGPARASFARFFAALDTGAAEEAFNIYMARARDHKDVPKHPGLRLMQMLTGSAHAEKRSELMSLLRAHHAGAPELAQVEKQEAKADTEDPIAAIRTYLRDRQWDQASRIHEKLAARKDPKPANIRLAIILYLSSTGRIAEARDALKAEMTDGRYPLPFMPLALRVLAEAGAWEEVYDACQSQLEALPAFPTYYTFFVKAARQTSRQKQLLEALGAPNAPKGDTRMQAIAALIEDIAESGEDVSALVNQHGLTAERRMRAEVKSPHPPARLKGLPDLALCYCTDASYFPPALVSIVSFAISNAWLARRTRINFLAGDDAMDRVPELQGIARRLGVSLEVKRAADIVPPDAELSGRYGFFTGGQALSSAAYYRIFLARALAAAGDVPQALYIDADTVIQPGLDQLFDTPMVQPLMARPDADRDEIKSLERAYGLKHSYFNSGVLRFDLRHAAALPALDAAIGCAIDPGRNLAFHDQCALNIGFNGQVDVLPERFNWFSSPDHLKPGQKPSDGVIVHYLDRTKPWDSLYQGDASGWFMYHALARRLAELG